MTANICMSNENDKYNIEQMIANVSIHSLEAGTRMTSYIVCSWDDRKLCKSTFQNQATCTLAELQISNFWL